MPDYIKDVGFTLKPDYDRGYPARSYERAKFSVVPIGGIGSMSCVRCHTSFSVSTVKENRREVSCPFCFRKIIGV